MKTKRSIYFLFIVLGATVMGIGDLWIKKEYALSIGMVILMLGIYNTSKLWNEDKGEGDNCKQ